MVCESEGNPVNPLEEGALEDDLGLMLMKSRSDKVEYKYENGRNILTLRVKV
jgi:anti-sigma regulatory factor (Ser/Thr protein kinase)